MERIFVFSDLHGDIHSLDKVLERIDEEKSDGILFAGDLGLDYLGTHRTKLRQLPIPITMVRGNCDSVWSFSEAQFPVPRQYATMTFGERTIFLTHGHLITHWEVSPLPLQTTDIYICGHTHRSQLIHPKGAPILLNPGSVTSPRDSNPPTYAMITSKHIVLHALDTGEIRDSLAI